MRDTYWGVSFDIPFILWKYWRPASVAEGAPQTHCNDIITKKTAATSNSDTELLNLFKELLEHRDEERGSTGPMINSMKHSFPLNNVTDPEKIVELSDEWLYNEPEFFSRTSVRSENSSSASSIDGGSLPSPRDTMQQGPKRIVVIDVARSKMSGKRVLGLDDLIQEFQTSTELERFMHRRRSPSNAKKRLCVLFATCPDANRVYSQTPSENLHMETFAKRHISYYKFFDQVTARALNKWTTEFHLSFYEIDKKGASNNVDNHFVHPQPRAGNEASGRLTRIAMSFRFDGDLFDRYWTCHFLQSGPQMTDFDAKREVIAMLRSGDHEWATDSKGPWRQRRVLELLMFGRIMLRMRECTDNILEDVKRYAWQEPGGGKLQQGTEEIHLRSSTEFNYDNFRAASWWCQEYQRILRMVEKDIRENLDQIELWLHREKDFGSERPRWTYNDEWRYRGVISKLLIENNRRVEELKRSYASFSSFNVSLGEKFQIARNDFDQRQAHNIRRFTCCHGRNFAASVFVEDAGKTLQPVLEGPSPPSGPRTGGIVTGHWAIVTDYWVIPGMGSTLRPPENLAQAKRTA
ncbi:Hypothetical protein NCS54_01397200 [Fusarium falciforme]|uniref:Hypothetical protein n=1 Tax=Fusarium falciforme TaxID=195108 RepID=UPI0023001602|nr:Hypothetical protein NCS54_01397200 [Fusarium falciforme]WAO96303.1 Hypothetical protein NCS54_01397200 [Fusarium falciforme]